MYKAIIELDEMLKKANIPHTFDSLFGGYQIRLNENIDAIEHDGSYGRHFDLIEIQGAMTKSEMQVDLVLGHLTAKQVFKRFKYCYKNNTIIYKVGK